MIDTPMIRARLLVDGMNDIRVATSGDHAAWAAAATKNLRSPAGVAEATTNAMHSILTGFECRFRGGAARHLP